jgi:2-aminobenzoate-CoA ligase
MTNVGNMKKSSVQKYFTTGFAKAVTPEWLDYPKKLNACEELLDANLKVGLGQKEAIITDSRAISYLELYRFVCNFSNTLSETGISRGERVIIRSTNTPEFIIALLAVIRLGAMAVPTHPRYSIEELKFVVKDTHAKLALGTGQFLEELQKAGTKAIDIKESWITNIDKEISSPPLLARAADPCLILYTSGTTGKPKGCVHTHRDYLVVSDVYGGKSLHVDSSDVITSPASLSFAFGHVGMVAIPFRFGSTVALYDEPKFDPVRFLEYTVKHKITILFGVPTMYRALLKRQGSDLAERFSHSVRVCVSAGEPCGADLARKWRDRFNVRILEHLGSTEMFDGFIGPTLDDEYPIGSLGRPLPGYQVRFGDKPHFDQDRKMKIGEVLVRGPITVRYWNRPRAQARININGWNRTRDVLGLDSSGIYWYISRSDTIIKTAGYRIAPHEVEHALQSCPLVSEAAVVGLPDSDRGNIVAAFIVPKNHSQAHGAGAANLIDEIRKYLEEHIANYKVPRLFKIVPELPKTSNGKIRRKVLLELEIEERE